jgi:hypothetical protein
MEFPCNLLSNVIQLKYKVLLIMTAMIEIKRNTKTGGTPSVSFIMSERLIVKEVGSLYYTSWFNTSRVLVHEQTYIY